jgi:hypothetical protein
VLRRNESLSWLNRLPQRIIFESEKSGVESGRLPQMP